MQSAVQIDDFILIILTQQKWFGVFFAKTVIAVLGCFRIRVIDFDLRWHISMLLDKPSSCFGCPLYGDGKGYVPDLVRPQAPVVVVGQNPGESEENGQKYLGNGQWESHPHAPLIGRTGRVFERIFLPLAGLNRDDISLANAFRCRFNHSNALPTIKQGFYKALAHCTQAHWRAPEGVKLYVAMGEAAAMVLTQQTSDLAGWRGYLLPYTPIGTARLPQTSIWTPQPRDPAPVLITSHLAMIWREPDIELPLKRDWNKIPQILDGKWPVPMSPIIREPLDVWPSYSAFDTEFAEDDHSRLIRYSIATRDRQVWVIESERVGKAVTLPGTTIIMHNAPADLPHAAKFLDVSSVDIEDTMYAHAVLWTGRVETDDQKGRTGGAMSHTLNFLGSMYARLNRWKHLARVAPIIYSGADAMGTMDVWETGLHGGLKGELERDPQSKWVYENLQKPLVPIIIKNQKRGIAVNGKAVDLALKDIVREQADYTQQAQAYCGWPINLRSPVQIAYWLYTVEGIRSKRKPFWGLK